MQKQINENFELELLEVNNCLSKKISLNQTTFKSNRSIYITMVLDTISKNSGMIAVGAKMLFE